jgi:hypothetical protein
MGVTALLPVEIALPVTFRIVSIDCRPALHCSEGPCFGGRKGLPLTHPE